MADTSLGDASAGSKRKLPTSENNSSHEGEEKKRLKAPHADLDSANIDLDVPLGLIEQVVENTDNFRGYTLSRIVAIGDGNMEVDVLSVGLVDQDQDVKPEYNSDNFLDSNANIMEDVIDLTNVDEGIETKETLTPSKDVKSSIVDILNNWYDYPTTHALGKLDETIPPPHLVVDGFGYVPLPMHALIAYELMKHMERSPYGRGEDTIMDPEYRNSYQIGPEKFHIENPMFAEAVTKIVGTVAEEFYFSPSNVTASLYKFLLYETGGLFKPHKDTEKENGMFATLIIQLPSVFTGGQFRVHHNGRIKKFDLSRQGSNLSSFYIAHFASCTHELTRIESGYRVALVYNLCWTGNATTIPPAPSYSLAEAATLRQLISAHLEETKKVNYPGNPLRLLWLLEHDYTDESLKTHGMKALKGKDAFAVKQLIDTNEDQNEDVLFEILLAEATKHEEGTCETHCSGYSKYDRWRCDDDLSECEMGECDESEIELQNFICLSELKPRKVRACLFTGLRIDPREDVVNFQEEDTFWGECKRNECEGFMGNYGGPVERWYSRRVLVVYFKADERKIAFLENADRAIRELSEGIKARKLTDEDEDCVLACKLTSTVDGSSSLVPDVTLLAFENEDLDFVKKVVGKISETDEGFGTGSERRGRKDKIAIYGYRYQGPETMEQKEDETGLTRCLKMYKARGNIDDLEPFLVCMIQAIGKTDKGKKTSSSSSDWERADECLRVVNEILPTKDVYGQAIFELFFEGVTYHYDQYGKDKASRYEKALKFLMAKYPNIIPANWETMAKSGGLSYSSEVASLIPFFQNSNLEMKDQIIERMVVGVTEFVMPKWIEAQTKRTGYGYYGKQVPTFQDEVQKLTQILATNERLMSIICEKFGSNAHLNCVGNWIDWAFDKNIQQVIRSPSFRGVLEKRVKSFQRQIAEPINELDSQFKTKKGEVRRSNAAQRAVEARNAKIQKRSMLISTMNKLQERLKSIPT